MKDENKTREQLLDELIQVRRRIADLEEAENESRRAQEALRESEERFRAYMDNSPTIAWMKDEGGHHVYLSRNYEKRFGVRLEDWRGKTDFELWPLEIAEEFWRNDQAVLTSWQMMEVIETTPNPDGGRCYWWNFKFPFTDTTGRRYVGGMGIEITEHKLMENKLREAKEFSEALFASMQDGLSILDNRGIHADVNPALCKMTGFSKEELLGAGAPHPYWPPEHHAEIESAFERTFAGEPMSFESTFMRKDGERFPVIVTPSQITDKQGKIFGHFATIKDITKRKKAEEALRESEELHRTILHTAMDGFMLVDMRGRLMQVNDAYCRMSGYGEQELLAMSIFDLEALEKPEETVAHMQKVIAHGQDRFESRHRRKDGSIFDLEVTVQHRPLGGGQNVAFLRDITEQVRQERELKLLNRLYSVLSRVSQAVVRARSPQTFLEETCRVIVEEGGFMLSWIGHVEEESKRVVPTAVWGKAEDYVHGISVYADDRPEGRGPTGTCIRERGPSVYNDFLHCPLTLPWRNRAAPYGIHAAAAFPIRSAESVWGALTIYSDEVGFFSVEYVKLLEKVADDIGFALDNLERERQRRQAEDALRESEERFQAAFNSSPNAIAISTPDEGIWIDVNQTAIDMFGYTREEVIGKSALKTNLWVDPRDRREIVEALSRDKAVRNREVKLRRKDGSLMITSVSLCTIKLKGKEYFLFVTEDITERKQIEKELQDSFNKLAYAQRAARTGFWDWDMPSGQLTWSREFYELFGMAPSAEASFDTWLKVLHPEDRDPAMKKISRSVEERTPLENEYRIILSDGQVRWISALGDTFYDEDGKPERMCGICVDSTERKRAEKEKEELEAKLHQVQKLEAIGTLAGGIAHDFNNVLSAIIGYTEMALDYIPEEAPARLDLQEVIKASNRAKDLVQQILVFSRRRGTQERVPMKASPIVKEAVKMLRASLPSTIEIREDIRTTGDRVLADPTQIHQVLVNLCTNAAHAMEEKGGVLEIGLTGLDLDERTASSYGEIEPGPYLRLSVTDDGCGMDSATLERIFDPYFTTKGVGKGSGLGLAVVHGIVKRHQGAIRVQSTIGKGTRFDVFLPRIQVEAITEAEVAAPNPTGTERILFVDDEQPLADLGKRMLESLGYNVTMSTKSTEALAIFCRQPDEFDLVVTDYTMPHMTGADLVKEILRVRPDIPVILCTGFSERITEDTARDLGISTLVMKPISKRAMAETVRKVLDKE